VGPGQTAALHTTHTHTRNPMETSKQTLQDDTLPMPPWGRGVWRGMVRLDRASGDGAAQPHDPGVRATTQLLGRPRAAVQCMAACFAAHNPSTMQEQLRECRAGWAPCCRELIEVGGA
jgi:hypothetical protein